MTDYRRLREPTSEALDTECCGQHLGRGKVIGDRLRWPPARPTTRKPNDQRPVACPKRSKIALSRMRIRLRRRVLSSARQSNRPQSVLSRISRVASCGASHCGK